MACPKCECKTTYPYVKDDEWMSFEAEKERCAACGHIFFVEDHLEEYDED